MLGQVFAARGLEQDTLDRRRRVLGVDRPDTLLSADNLASYLRALGMCRPVTGSRRHCDRRRVLGAEHSDTLRSARPIGICLPVRRLA